MPLVAALVLLWAPAAAALSDIPSEPLDWLLLPVDSLVARGGERLDTALALCEEMGWSEKEYRLRAARLARGDLAPAGREEETLRLARLAIRTGRDEKAVELLDPWRRSDPETVVAAGLAALRSGRHEPAARLLRVGQALGAPAADLVRFRLAEALGGLDGEERGLPLLLEIAGDPADRFREDALHAAALLLFDAGRDSAAVRLLRGAYGEKYEKLVHRELLYRVAAAEERHGNALPAGRLYKRLLEKWPGHDRALPAFRALRMMESDGTIPPDPRLPILGARAARSAGRSVEAIQLLRPLLDRDRSDPLHDEALLEIGKTHYEAEQYRSALETFDRLAAAGGEKGRIALLYRARSYKKMGDWPASIEAYRQYVTRYPESTLAPEVQWEIAWRLKLLHEYDEAAAAFRRLAARFPGSEFAPRAPLQEGLCLDAAGRPAEARNVLERIVRSGGRSAGRRDALFWIGDLGERLDQTGRTREVFDELVREYPETYYGLRAAGRLGEEAIVPPAPILAGGEGEDDPTLRWITGWSGEEARAGAEKGWGDLSLFAAWGEWAEARREAAAIRRRLADDPVGLLDLARLCRASALYDVTIRCGRRIQTLAERAGADPVHPYLLALIYPLGYLDLVVAACEPYPEIDPLFVLATIRQESWFAPAARSRAGARGLMQIMPATGRHIARRLGEEKTYTDALLDAPAQNIRYGVWYIHSLLRRYDGDRLVAASAYNAGEGNADLWLAGEGPPVGEAYVERISYSETRNYVKQILSGYWICLSIYRNLATDRHSG